MRGELIGEPPEQARQAALIAGALLAPATAAASPDGAKLTIAVTCADGARLEESLALRPDLPAELVRHAVMHLRQRYENTLDPAVLAAVREAALKTAASSAAAMPDRPLSASVAPPGAGAGFVATQEGGFAKIEPLTSHAKAWLKWHTGGETSWVDGRLIVELRYFPALADAIIEAGFLFEGDSIRS